MIVSPINSQIYGCVAMTHPLWAEGNCIEVLAAYPEFYADSKINLNPPAMFEYLKATGKLTQIPNDWRDDNQNSDSFNDTIN